MNDNESSDTCDDDGFESEADRRSQEQYDLSLSLYEPGRELFDCGCFEDAIGPLKNSWDVMEDSKTAEVIARCYTEMRDYARAIHWFSRSISLNPKRQPIYRFRAELYEQIGNLESALRDYEKAVEINPVYKRCRLAAERLRKRLGKTSDDAGS